MPACESFLCAAQALGGLRATLCWERMTDFLQRLHAVTAVGSATCTWPVVGMRYWATKLTRQIDGL